MKLKLRILNLKSFLQTLAHNFEASQRWMPLTIRLHTPQNYFSVVSYAAGL